MRYIHRKITIINLKKPTTKSINLKLQWLGSSLGLFGLRDKDKSLFRVFIELLKSSKEKKPLSSDELAYMLSLTRGTVIHHINKLMESGLVIHEKKKYMLRVDNLKSLIEEVEKDMKRTCDDLKSVAKDIDDKLGLE
jgi:predicted transcriptional regulator